MVFGVGFGFSGVLGLESSLGPGSSSELSWSSSSSSLESKAKALLASFLRRAALVLGFSSSSSPCAFFAGFRFISLGSVCEVLPSLLGLLLRVLRAFLRGVVPSLWVRGGPASPSSPKLIRSEEGGEAGHRKPVSQAARGCCFANIPLLRALGFLR